MPSPNSDPNSSRVDAPPAASGSPSILVSLAKREHQTVSTGYAPRTGMKLAVGAILVTIILGGAFFVVQLRRSRRESELQAEATVTANTSAIVEVATVKYGPETQLFPETAHVSAWHETTIFARVSGYLATWSADIGDHVVKDQSLATIETPELDDQLSAAQAKLKVSESDVVVAKAATDFAETTNERWQGSPKGIVSDQEREEKKAEYESSKARLDAANAQVKLDQANVNSLTELANFKQVRAPFDGVITARRIDVGDLVTAGSTASTTSLYSLAQYDQVRVFVDVPQSASAEITVGMTITFVASEYPDRKFQGKVGRTSSAIDPVSRTLHVEVDVPNTDLALLPGMSVQAMLEIKQKTLLEVPASALIFRSNGQQVAVVDQDDKVHLHNVTIGSDHGDFVEIASGLSPNDRVALNLSSQVAEGDHVTTVDADAAASTTPPAPSRTATSAASSK